MKIKNIVSVFLITRIIVFIVSYTVRIETEKSYAESLIVRWKFALYKGECDDETGCHCIKMKGTGVLEYFGFKKIYRFDKK